MPIVLLVLAKYIFCCQISKNAWHKKHNYLKTQLNFIAENIIEFNLLFEMEWGSQVHVS